jgi:hypothetical protein
MPIDGRWQHSITTLVGLKGKILSENSSNKTVATTPDSIHDNLKAHHDFLLCAGRNRLSTIYYDTSLPSRHFQPRLFRPFLSDLSSVFEDPIAPQPPRISHLMAVLCRLGSCLSGEISA